MEEGYGVSAQDLVDCGWRNARPIGGDEDYLTMGLAFQKASSEAASAGRDVDSQALKLFAAATSMMLRSSSTNTPFGPVFEGGGRRSALPQDFSKTDLDALGGACQVIDDPWIKARFADIVWLSSKPRDIVYARLACDAYVSIPLEATNWYHGSAECWARAIALCRQLGRGELPRLERMETDLVVKARAVQPEDAAYLRRLAKLLSDGRLGKAHALEVAKLLRASADARMATAEVLQARHFYDSASEWFQSAADDEQRIDCLCAVAETFVREAEARIAADTQGHMVAASFYESAIQAFRRVPKAKRTEREVDRRIAEIHNAMKLAGQQSVDQMVTINSGPTDVTEIAEAARAYVQGKSLGDAIHAFSRVHVDAGRQAHVRQAEELFRSSFFQGMVEVTHLGADGRVVAKRPGITPGDFDSPAYQAALWAEAVKAYVFDMKFAAQALIYPAFDMLLSEHRFLLVDLVELARHSPIVPPNREQLVGKALFFGFEGDFETALHLGVPQVEHLVRWQLSRNGVKTTTLDPDGIETENGLSTLTDLPEFATVFGEDLSFEIRALFCDSFGPNLRNEVAHGLLASGDGNSVESFYAWWLLLKLVFNHFVAAQVRTASTAHDRPTSDEAHVEPKSQV